MKKRTKTGISIAGTEPIDQSSWPAHLRDDAPHQQCGRCHRKTWDVDQFDKECRMTQPDGFPCGGTFTGSTS